jgi:A/G-specific adenine glycosylase
LTAVDDIFQSPAALRDLRRALLQHYDDHRRPLPWRREPDPYRILVAEFMLQQTRVETVVPYYERWLRRFPDLLTLADAPPDDVLKAWEGLGYYRRARNLHAAAIAVCERHGGALPRDPETLRGLPGVGEYTAGAVASIAYGVVAPAVDGNVRRVLARLTDEPAPGAARLRELATVLVDPDRPGAFNQALMELGATVCTPRSPSCGRCPLAAWCHAHARGTQEDRPSAPPRRQIPEEQRAVAVLVDSARRVLLVRRPASGLLAGLWEHPSVVVRSPRTAAAAARRLAGALLRAAPPRPARLEPVRHVFSHLRVVYHPFLFRVAGGGGAGWFDPVAQAELTLPVAQQRIAALVAAASSPQTSNDGFGPPPGGVRRGARL